MIITRKIGLGVAACLLGASAHAQTLTTVATESFDYPAGSNLGQQAGGTGWANAWWGGNADDHALVTTPGFDAVGNRITSNIPNGGCYRVIDPTGPNANIADVNGRFGLDDTTIWFSFDIQRVAGGDDDYGGFSLFDQFNGPEKLFIGKPVLGNNEWGIQDDPFGGTIAQYVAGTSVDTLARLVIRIDFLPGMERLRMWVSPAVAHPTTAADMDTMLHDFVFNEVRYESGNGILGPTGFHFDNLVIEATGIDPTVAFCSGDGSGTACPCGNSGNPGAGCDNSFATGGGILDGEGVADTANDTLFFSVTGLPNTAPGLYFQGTTQENGGLGNLFGDGLRCVGGQVIRLGTKSSSGGASMFGAGIGSDPLISVKGGVTSGDMRHYQVWYRNTASFCTAAAFNLTNALSVSWL